MNFTATMIGAFAGFWVTHYSLLGALVGAALGFMFDASRQQQRSRAAPVAGGYIHPLFALIGAVAKADGRISEAEIAIAERLMSRFGLDTEQRRDAIIAFNEGKQPEFNATVVINELRAWVGHRRDHSFTVLDVVMETVLAEGEPAPEKMAILRQLAFALRISDMELMALMAMKGYAWNATGGGQRGRAYGGGNGGGYVPPHRNTQGPDPYAILGIQRDADDRAIKRAYRKLISEHHPDRLGDLPEDMRRRAESRASDINAAYERIKAERGFK
ncbi:DnaJ like chaperone protein [Luteibacter rhizovicinus]|uniref:DnaJ like chaperone protein n=1 Tax=Luteibacter rhizovicinus TaxID=242606 RepID=A0A4V2W3E1_9GAMM|nr:co-chaperone DjlA [Luteibacter rhizovicinus]TCV91599.1 DnaJ like chaperone protein [Luteibacter rhizovicinus]